MDTTIIDIPRNEMHTFQSILQSFVYIHADSDVEHEIYFKNSCEKLLQALTNEITNDAKLRKYFIKFYQLYNYCTIKQNIDKLKQMQNNITIMRSSKTIAEIKKSMEQIVHDNKIMSSGVIQSNIELMKHKLDLLTNNPEKIDIIDIVQDINLNN